MSCSDNSRSICRRRESPRHRGSEPSQIRRSRPERLPHGFRFTVGVTPMGRVLSKVVAYSIELGVIAFVVAVLVIGCHSFGGRQVVRKHYDSGSLWQEIQVDSHGLPHGRFLELYENGTLKRDAEYSHGSWVSGQHFYPNGQVSQESTMGPNGDVVRAWLEDGTEITPPPQ
jgi:hypothetical protein